MIGTMKCTLGGRKVLGKASLPVTSRRAVAVKAYKITLKTPEGERNACLPYDRRHSTVRKSGVRYTEVRRVMGFAC